MLSVCLPGYPLSIFYSRHFQLADPADYQGVNEVLIVGGANLQDCTTITIIEDNVVEDPEVFLISLSSGSSSVNLSPDSATVVIADSTSE